jgi:hypothetical protein
MVCPEVSPRYTAAVRSEAKALEVASRVGDCRLLDVFEDDVSDRSGKFVNEPRGVWPEVASDEASSSGCAEWLAGEPGTENVNANSI